MPDERFLTVRDIAERAGVDAHVVRFYARTGLIRPSRYAANGYRQFDAFDAQRVRFVRAAQSLGFTLSDVRVILSRSRLRKTPCPLVRDTIERRLTENRERLQYVAAMQDRMQRASEQWRQMPDKAPRGDSICALIEAVADDTSTAPPKSSRTRRFARP